MGVLNPTLEKIYSFHKEREIAVLSFRAFGTSCKVKYSPLDSISIMNLSPNKSYNGCRVSNKDTPVTWRIVGYLLSMSAGVKPIPLTQEDELTLRASGFPSFKVNRRLTHPVLPHRSLAKGKSKKSITSRT